VSKKRHFLAYLLLPILISGCTLRPMTLPSAEPDTQKASTAAEETEQLKQRVAQLERKLEATRKAKDLLQQQHQELEKKMKALTDIERSLYQRRLENSE